MAESGAESILVLVIGPAAVALLIGALVYWLRARSDRHEPPAGD